MDTLARGWDSKPASLSLPALREEPIIESFAADLTKLNELKAEIDLTKDTQFKEEGVSDLIKWLPDPTVCTCKALLEPIRYIH